MKIMGITSLDWFSSYLTGRQQCVGVGGTNSDFMNINCGVPQGSILGPTLFLCYVNDMAISLKCRLALYADDSALIYSGKSAGDISEFLSRKLESCLNWLIDNKLSLHIGKTECMLFGTRRRLKKAGEYVVTLSGEIIKRVTSVRYLGVILDENMNAQEHVLVVLKKSLARISFLYRKAFVLDTRTRKLLCSALIQPYLDFCCASWYTGLTVKLRDRLDVLQRKMIRFIFNKEARDHVGQHELRELSWLSILDRVRYFKLVHTFRVFNNLAPTYLSERFDRVKDKHGYNLRGHEHNYYVPKSNGAMASSFTVTAAQEWNRLPSHLKSCNSLESFKIQIKNHFLSQY
jgi:ribonuclease P/MRP protein subunit RPP40